MGGIGMRVRGLKELGQELRRIEPGMQREIQKVNKSAVKKIVPIVHRAYRGQYRTSGRSLRGIRATASQRRASITIGGARFPYLIGQEFGSNKWPQFRPWTGPAPGGGVGSRGRFLYPTMRDDVPASVMEDYLDAFDKLFRRAFPGGVVTR